MKHHGGYFKSIRDTNIFYQYWLPEGKPKAILLIAHGIAEYSGRYMHILKQVCNSRPLRKFDAFFFLGPRSCYACRSVDLELDQALELRNQRNGEHGEHHAKRDRQ
jgi:hypothetical protein